MNAVDSQWNNITFGLLYLGFFIKDPIGKVKNYKTENLSSRVSVYHFIFLFTARLPSRTVNWNWAAQKLPVKDGNNSVFVMWPQVNGFCPLSLISNISFLVKVIVNLLSNQTVSAFGVKLNLYNCILWRQVVCCAKFTSIPKYILFMTGLYHILGNRFMCLCRCTTTSEQSFPIANFLIFYYWVQQWKTA